MRIRSLDSIRFFAALCVAIFHFNIDLNLKLDSIFRCIDHFGLCVDFFFALSGFVIATNYASKINNIMDYGVFIKKRLARVYPLHFVTLLAFAGLGTLASIRHIPINHAVFFSAAALPANLLLVQSWGVLTHGSFNNGSWSVSAEFFLYLIFPVFAWMSSKFSPLANLAAIVIFMSIMELTRRALGLESWTGATYDFGNFRAVPPFFVGVVIAKVLPPLMPRLKLGWPWVYMLLASALLAMQLDLPDGLTFLILAALIAASACAENNSQKSVLVSRPLVVLGDASYSIYMIHGLVLLPAVYLIKATYGLGTFAAGLCGAAALAATLVLSIGVYHFFETPARHYLNQLKLPVRGRVPVQ